MSKGHSDEFRRDAVRIALSSRDQDLIQWIKYPAGRVNAAAGFVRFGGWPFDAEQVDQIV